MSCYKVEGIEGLVENIEVYGLDESIVRAKFPMSTELEKLNDEITTGILALARSNTGEGHDQFLTGITVQFDLTFSNKAWVEAERYRFLEFVSSQSTMHRITQFNLRNQYNEFVDVRVIEIMEEKLRQYKEIKKEYDETPEEDRYNRERLKKLLDRKYLELLYTNPAGFELTARMTTNYRCLKNIYQQRKSHRLPEWRKFCEWIETLPYAKELIINA